MSYNITSIKYIGTEKLTINAADLARASTELRGKTPARCFIDDIKQLNQAFDVFQIGQVEWCGECANDEEALFRALSYTQGSADLLVIWEGGDSLTGLRVHNGVVTEHEVVMRLGKEAD